MTLNIFARGFWLQTRIALFFFIGGLLIGWLAMSLGLPPKVVNNSSTILQELPNPLKDLAEKTISGKNENSWVYFFFINGLANTLFISLFFMAATYKPGHEFKCEIKNYSAIDKFVAWYLRVLGLTVDSSPTLLNLAAMLTFPNVVGFGFLSISFGVFTVSAVKLIGPWLTLAAIIPHGIFEIPAALASGSMSLAMLIEIIRQKRENRNADTWQISRQLTFSRSTAKILTIIFALTLIAAIIEGHYTELICESIQNKLAS